MKKTFPEDRVNLGVNKITPYQPGKSSDSLNISKEKLIKLASNENPIGPSKLATDALKNSFEFINNYPSSSHEKLRKAIAKVHAINFENIICGAGSDELISFICQLSLSFKMK